MLRIQLLFDLFWVSYYRILSSTRRGRYIDARSAPHQIGRICIWLTSCSQTCVCGDGRHLQEINTARRGCKLRGGTLPDPESMSGGFGASYEGAGGSGVGVGG